MAGRYPTLPTVCRRCREWSLLCRPSVFVAVVIDGDDRGIRLGDRIAQRLQFGDGVIGADRRVGRIERVIVEDVFVELQRVALDEQESAVVDVAVFAAVAFGGQGDDLLHGV